MIGAVPVHVPLLTVSASPSCGVPEMVGGAEFAGAFARWAIWAVGSDEALRSPSEFRAVTETSSRRPTSFAVSRYVFRVAPRISLQLLIRTLHRIHWKL